MAKVSKKTCSCCEKELRQQDFYRSNSKLYSDGKLPICKSCFNSRFEELLTTYNGDINAAFRHLLMNFDIYYQEELYLQCSSKENFIGEYMRMCGSTKERKDKTSLNNKMEVKEIKEVSLEDGVVTQELVDFWGSGYTFYEYTTLERKYKMYSEHYPNKRLQEQEMIKQLCELDIMKENCRKSGDKNGYDKICTQIRKTMDDLRVLPKQSGEDEEELTLGNIIRMIEYEEPIPMTTPEFNDVNKIEQIMSKYFVTPFKRVLGLKNKEVGETNE